MGTRIISRLWIALRLLFPSPFMLKYARKIRQSELFDRQFYLASTPNLHPLAKVFPLRHYILRGETVGLCPNQNFSPLAYLHKNPSLKAINTPPLMHYINTGQDQNLKSGFAVSTANNDPVLIPEINSKDYPCNPASFAIVVHIYYHDLWAEISSAIKRQTFSYDLFITLNRFSAPPTDLIRAIHQDFPAAQVWVMPNHGRDIFPFVHLLNSGILSPYKAVCKLHTKKSLHRHDGDQWRDTLINGILGDARHTKTCLDIFCADKTAAFWTADGQHYQGEKWWGQNKARTAELLKRVSITADGAALSFPAGSIYWVKPTILKHVQEMNLHYKDFEPEQGQIDGTTAHAIERCFGFLAQASRTTIKETRALSQLHAHPVLNEPNRK